MTDNKTDARHDDSAASSDDSWETFAREHQDELNNLEQSKDAKKFEKHIKKAQKAQKAQGGFSSSDFKNNAFIAGNPHGPRTYSTSWFDADEADSHFTPPHFSSPLSLSAIIGLILGAAAVVLLILSLNMPSASSLLATLSAICVLLSLGLIVNSVRSSRR